MIRLASIIHQFEAELLEQSQALLLPSQLKALSAMKRCRSELSLKMKACCSACDHSAFIPHSCGHRLCPHCQHHEGQQWIEQQLQKQVPSSYFMVTFTLPQPFRALAWQHQRQVYQLMFECAWLTLKQFTGNEKQLGGIPGVIAVLHTHARSLAYHPHIHTVMPAASIHKDHRWWCKKRGKYLFNHKALAKVFRAKFLAACVQHELILPSEYPEKWVVDCRYMGDGDKVIRYLGRYLYRGVLSETNIVRCKEGQVTFRYQDSATKRWKRMTLSGVEFLLRILRHALPKGFRRARNYGFLHPNSKGLIHALHLALKFFPCKWMKKPKPRPVFKCSCCGAAMIIVRTRIAANTIADPPDEAVKWEGSNHR
jgi:hypothetical protein